MRAYTNASANDDSGRAARAHFNASRTRLNIEIHRTSYIECPLERTFGIRAERSAAAQGRERRQNQTSVSHLISS
jgi:hypothetical protein